MANIDDLIALTPIPALAPERFSFTRLGAGPWATVGLERVGTTLTASNRIFTAYRNNTSGTDIAALSTDADGYLYIGGTSTDTLAPSIAQIGANVSFYVRLAGVTTAIFQTNRLVSFVDIVAEGGWFITGSVNKGYYEANKATQVRTTTSSQVAAAATFTPPNSCVITTHATVVGTKEDGTDRYVYDRVSVFNKTSGGVVTEMTPTADNTANPYPAAAAGVSASLDISGAAVVLNVTGPSNAANWAWTVSFSVVVRSHTWTP